MVLELDTDSMRTRRGVFAALSALLLVGCAAPSSELERTPTEALLELQSERQTLAYQRDKLAERRRFVTGPELRKIEDQIQALGLQLTELEQRISALEAQGLAYTYPSRGPSAYSAGGSGGSSGCGSRGGAGYRLANGKCASSRSTTRRRRK